MVCRILIYWLAGLSLPLVAAKQDPTEPAGDMDASFVDEIDDLIEEPQVELPAKASVVKGDDGSVLIEEIVEPPNDYHYAAFGRANPFKEPIYDPNQVDSVSSDMSGVGSMDIPIISELQKYDVDALKVKGIWEKGANDRRAIVMTPERKGIIVRVGDPISSGKIVDIEADKVIARLYSIRLDGSREFRDAPIYLGEAQPQSKGFIRLVPGKDPIFSVDPNEAAKDKARFMNSQKAAAGSETGSKKANESINMPKAKEATKL